MVNAIKAAIGDAVLTFMFVFVSSTLGLVTNEIIKALDLHHVSYKSGLDYPFIVITTILIFVLVTTFTFIGNALGGASFNPTGNASFYAAGLGSDTLFSMALRFPAQVCYACFYAKKGSFFFPLFLFWILGVLSWFRNSACSLWKI